MKLISCHIDNFGKLHNLDFTFDDKLVVIKEDNSWGKTTLATFIASMFYGLPSLRGQLISENERRHYAPWQGGNFGGSLVFEFGQKQYEVRRVFDVSGSKDTFRLTDVSTKKVVDKIGDKRVDAGNLGETLFGINKSSYMRSAFIPQGDIAFHSDKNSSGKIEDGLNERLRNLINATDKNNNYSNAVKRIDKAIDSIETKRGKGKLSEVALKISGLSDKIQTCIACLENAEAGRESLAQYEEQLSKIKFEIVAIDKKIDEQKSASTLQEQRARYQQMVEAITSERLALDKSMIVLNGQKIEEINLAKIKNAIDDAESQKQRTERIRNDSLEERAKLENQETQNRAENALRELYEGKKASAEKECNRLHDELTALKGKQKPLSLFLILACIVTLGIFFFVWKSKQKSIEAQIADCERKLNDAEKEIQENSHKLEGFNVPSQQNGEALEILNQRLKDAEEEYRKLKREAEEQLDKFISDEQEPLLRYASIQAAYNAVIEGEKRLIEKEKNLKTFLQDKDESKLLQETDGTSGLDELNENKKTKEQKKEEILRQVERLKKEIEDNESIADDFPDYEAEKEECERFKAKLQKDLDTLKRTKEFLYAANEKLANQYLSPLNCKCCEFVESFDKDKALLSFDTDSKILIHENGEDRELDYFSTGNKELISLCMRVALIDLIFTDDMQKPCVILDDPFVNLDDNKINVAKDFLSSLSERYQIIYLTCSDSRTM